MFNFFKITRSARVSSNPVDPLSIKINEAWATYNDAQDKVAKKDAYKFLINTFKIFENQPNAKQKLKTLMQLKNSSDNPNYIPSVYCLPIDLDLPTILLIRNFTYKSELLLRQVDSLGFGDEDTSKEKYYCQQWNEIRNTKLLEKAVALYFELFNTIYGLRKDPLSNALRKEMEKSLSLFSLTDPNRKLVRSYFAGKIAEISIQERANNYKNTISIDPEETPSTPVMLNIQNTSRS